MKKAVVSERYGVVAGVRLGKAAGGGGEKRPGTK